MTPVRPSLPPTTSVSKPTRLTSGLAVLLVLAALLAPAGAAAGRPVVPIIDLHNNLQNGTPAPPYTVGTAVSVSGIITVGHGTFTPTYTDVYVQDATAGVMIYDVAVPYQFQLGDSVTINGTIAQYRGMTEVDLGTWTVHASGVTVPAAAARTCYQVEHVFQPNYSEPDEGRLVRLNNVTWSGAWPSFSGGVTLHDGSGTCTMFIDGTTGIQEMTPPTGPFNVVGVVKQYAGYAPPYTSSYEILPRSPDDIILLPGPQIIAGPRETDIQHDQVTIHLETDTETTCTIQYGVTAAYELGTATDGVESLVHDVVLPGLTAATIHHYRVTVENGGGSTSTPDKLFCSGSAPGCTGYMRAIFNKSVDHSLAGAEPALGGQDLAGWIIDRINATNVSIDVALYSFDLSAVADALIAAKNRGVRIRFVYDNRNPYQPEVTRLRNNGIFVIDDGFGPHNDGSEIMHHKLWVFDALSTDPAAQWVYTGSWNLSNEGTYTDAQNVIMVQDQALAAVCTAEFNEMWGSSTAVPNPDVSRFGDRKTDNTPKIFNVAGREVRIYFAPSDPWIAGIIDEVRAADERILFSVMSFTRFDLCDEMEDRWMSVPEFAVRGVFDSAESGNESSQYHPMHGDGEYAWSPPADVWLDAETGTLHHKYMIIDVDRPSADPVLITGSANWSNAAVQENDENVLIVHDATIANCYLQEFADRYHAAGGTGDLTTSGVVAADAGRAPLRVGPNPANVSWQARFSLRQGGRVTGDLFGIDGRQLSRVFDQVLSPGIHQFDWQSSQARDLPAGIYYLRVDSPDGTWKQRLALVR